MRPERAGFERATPILAVSDLVASLAYYTTTLGFSLDWRLGSAASVSRDGVDIMLVEGDQGRAGTWVWIGVTDADAVHAELEARGAVIRHPPTNYSWARELQVSDPDGHVLRLGSDVPPGASFGEWLDGEGQRWAPRPDGS